MNTLNHKNKSGIVNHNKKLIMGLTDRAANLLDEAWSLWELDPSSKNIRDKFYLLKQCLDHIKKICEDRL